MRWILSVLCVLLVALSVAPAQAQQREELPEEARQALEERGMTIEEARQRLRQLGIDPSNPEQAARRARQLGVPEARIQSLLQAARQRRGRDTTGVGMGQREVPRNPPFPVLAGTPEIEPDSISVGQLPRDIEVRVPLRSQNQIRRVRPGFLTAGGDSVQVQNVQRVRGSVVDGTWRGRLTIPRDTSDGTWGLFVRASTRDTTVTLATGRRLTIFPKGELPDRDTTRAGRDTLTYFGYDTFKTIPEAFTPQPSGPADDGYVVGPDDELRLTVWGGAEFTYELPVDEGGRVTVPNVGQFTVSGKSLEELRTEMKEWLSRSYSGLTSDPPTVFMDLTLTRVRPTQVFVLGEVAQPGGYMVSGYSTVFNALYSVGGPLKRGSLRNISVIRDGEVVETVDLYDYLLQGYSPDPVQLQSNDYIFVPPRGETVAITGPVKRPAYYEMKEDETVADLLDYAGGLKPNAYTKRFQIERIVPFAEREDPSVAREVLDASLQAARADTAQVPLADGDRVKVLSISEARSPTVKARVDAAEVTGAVLQPGQYEIGGPVRTVKDLIEQADGLTGDAYREQADLVRIDDTLSETSQSLDLQAVMEDRPQANVVLQPGDSLHVASIQEMRADRQVRITGQVRDPGQYRFREGMTVRSLLRKAGGLTDDEYLKDVFLGRADLFRVSRDGDEERVIPFHLGDALEGDGMADRTLRPEDEIRIYPATVERLEEQFVQISGAVQDTGRYAFRDNMTLKDAILQANGFTEGASLQQVTVTRMVERQGQAGERASTISVPLVERDLDPKDVDFSVRDTAQALEVADNFDLQHRDRIFIRKNPAFQPQETVSVQGEVQYPGEYTLLRDNERLSSVIQRAGGILSTGYLKGGRLIRPEAQADRGFRAQREGEQVIVEMERAVRGNPAEDVILRPGDEIVIPTQPNTVAIRGNVANEGLIKHEAGRRVDYYLDRAGGTRENTQDVFLTQASGATFKVNTGWFRRAPVVDDGAVIRVEEEPEQEQEVNYTEIASSVTQILSSTLSVILLGTRVFE
ncbi:protein involved in polysaccharide export with SLBB domain [Salinibacter ruber]|uniref:SLBB domain-containing protein n=1 Tax=Salinibacter ruber TaxID=146919 RepID=UPI002169A2B9|nr:SLBB domain-containing protein [Salinibacter ruber]MCS4182628.1 protein involved in polysaccharide export with SLBB domain [Salinibacter ruber]MCS4189232.1 protein involved in polysaccharide export with SLBB domain [Salinibacter ruber]